MLRWFRRDPLKKLEARYEALMAEAQALQRAGDIPAFALKSAEADAVREELDALRRDWDAGR